MTDMIESHDLGAPWKMKLGEYVAQAARSEWDAWDKASTKARALRPQYGRVMMKVEKTEADKQADKAYLARNKAEQKAIAVHRRSVEAALKAGLPVPHDVVEIDYADISPWRKIARINSMPKMAKGDRLWDAHYRRYLELGELRDKGITHVQIWGSTNVRPIEAVIQEDRRGSGGVMGFARREEARAAREEEQQEWSKSTDLQSIHDSRSPRSKESDERQSNADTIEPDDPRVEQWVWDQGRMDIVGIDTPRKGKGKKVARKTRKSTRTETQVRGIRR